MLFWEVLSGSNGRRHSALGVDGGTVLVRTCRLPYDKQCVAQTRSGSRCRGRIRKGAEFCPFHDPALTAERRRRIAARGGHNHRRLSHLPDGYLRKLSNWTAVGQAMDRLYREVRLGIISNEMGAILFRILTRLLDSGLITSGPCPQRTKAARIRPKLSRLLTRKEQTAWEQAVAKNTSTPRDVTTMTGRHSVFARAIAERKATHAVAGGTVDRTFQAAS